MRTTRQDGRHNEICNRGMNCRPRNRSVFRVLFLAAVMLAAIGSSSVRAQKVQALLFFSPTCQHCHQVITQYLPILFDDHGGPPRLIANETIPQSERSLFLFYNSRLEILLVDASKTLGGELYMASTRNQQIPPQHSGVPRLVIGDEYLVGSIDIPERTGEIVRQGLEQGGIGWPDVDGLVDALASVPAMARLVGVQAPDSATTATEATTATDESEDSVVIRQDTSAALDSMPEAAEESPEVPQPDEEQADSVSPEVADSNAGRAPDVEVRVPPSPAPAVQETEAEPESEIAQPDAVSSDSAAPFDTTTAVPSAFNGVPTRELSMLEKFQLDPVGNGFSVLVLLLMAVSVVAVWLKPDVLPTSWGVGYFVPVLALIGVVVAGYLTYIEATGVMAVCGPVGDCNTVNQSEYARLFGVVPIGALGLAGYVAIALVWAVAKYDSGTLSLWASVLLFAMAVFGTLFSIYLTFLEPFVIGATCAWCLTSSIIITAFMWLFSNPGREAWTRIRSQVS